MKRILTFFLASILLLGLVCSCNGDEGKGGGNGNDVIKTDDDYKIPEIDMNGEDITVLNVSEFAHMKIDFVVPEDADDTLDIAMYESNKRIEEQFNFTLVEDDFPYSNWSDTYIEMASHFVKNVNSGDDVYDFIHFPVNQRMELMTSGYIMDLSELDGLHLDKPWWDAQINKVINVNGRQYMACGSINLGPYEAMTAIFFNKDILANNGLDDPYEMVHEGTWTIDKMVELGREAMNLNTDQAWGVLEGGTSVYGVAKHEYFPSHFLVGAGVQFVTEKDGEYTFALDSDDFYLAVEKIQDLFTDAADGGIAGFQSAEAGGAHYITQFGNGRALFLMSELKAGVEMRQSEINFGILPAPKLRAEQEMYYTDETERLHYICIPTLSDNPDDVASIVDAMAYDRYKNVVPVYYDSYIEYKGLRDEESLKMLEIMSAGRTVDIGFAYGWCNEFIMQRLNLNITSDQISSIVAAATKSINSTIEDFVDNYLN